MVWRMRNRNPEPIARQSLGTFVATTAKLAVAMTTSMTELRRAGRYSECGGEGLRIGCRLSGPPRSDDSSRKPAKSQTTDNRQPTTDNLAPARRRSVCAGRAIEGIVRRPLANLGLRPSTGVSQLAYSGVSSGFGVRLGGSVGQARRDGPRIRNLASDGVVCRGHRSVMRECEHPNGPRREITTGPHP